MELIRVEHLSKSYENSMPLKDVNVSISQGEIIALIGPSGTGKTTLLKCILGLENSNSGNIYLFEEKIANPKEVCKKYFKKINMMFQQYNLFEHKTVLENVSMAQIKNLKRSKKEANEISHTILDKLGLKDVVNNYPDKLSGGQQQRVAMARTLAMDTDVMFVDEPTAALDPVTVDIVSNVFKELAQKGKTIVMVTHDFDFAKKTSTRVLFMEDGIIYEEGSPNEIFENPKKSKTIEFMKTKLNKNDE